MSVTKDGFYNIEGKIFEVVHGVEGDCLTLGDEDGGTRISGPKPWCGGQVTKTFVTREKYGPIERLEEENAKLRDENARLRESVRNLLTCVKHEECEESCPNYEPMYTDYGYEKNGSTVVESEYLGCCTVGLENCNSMLFDTGEYLRELGIEVD